jgi:AP-3 complex subunit mu
VKYVTNEIYFDLVEQIDAIIGANQQLIAATIYGDINCNCKLSGMPDLTLSFTKPQLLDDCSLHKCVRINRFQREKVISFVPPDGNFKLLSFKINSANNSNINIPLYVKPTVSYRNGSGRIYIQVGSKQLANEKPCTNVIIHIPLPRTLKTHSLQANVGTVKYDSDQSKAIWEIGKLPKELTPTLEGSVSLNSSSAENDSKQSNPPIDEYPTITAEFQVKMYAASGLKVDGLAIRGVGYKPFKGVRSITQAGKFQIRTIDS